MADWLTTKEAVQQSGLTINHIRQLIRSKVIVAEKKGGHYWVNRESLWTHLNPQIKVQEVASNSLPIASTANFAADDKNKVTQALQAYYPHTQPPPLPKKGFDLATAYRHLINAYLRVVMEESKPKDAHNASSL
ncbi:MAG: hypothetical protein HC853_06105 [Anaerolineae bacterium]|nr:hypothetical protein [Anaerolineae bacterium]